MYKKPVVLFLFLISVSGFSQVSSKNEESILIYSEGQGFLQPFIESSIKSFKNSKTDSLFFKRVNSLNTFVSNSQYQAILNDLIRIQKPDKVKLKTGITEEENKIKEAIFNILVEYDYFLSVKTNTLGELIEFQFQLFETQKPSKVENEKSVPFNISDKIVKVENFFINPKSSSYLNEINNALQRLFIDTNKQPEAEFKLFNEVVRSNDTLYLPMNTIVSFDGSGSGDYDSNELEYIWRNIPKKNEKYQNINKFSFEKNLPIQKVEVNKSGEYKIGFKVFDGVQFSEEIILNLKTIKKPKIYLAQKMVKSYEYKSIVSAIKGTDSSAIFRKEIRFKKEKWEVDSENKVIVSNSRLIDQLNDANIGSVDSLAVVSDLAVKNAGTVLLNTKFYNPFFTTKKQYFIYSLGPDRLLSDEEVLVHNLIERRIFNFKLKYNTSFVDYGVILPESERRDNYLNFNEAVTFYSLDLGIFFTKNFSFNIDIPFSKRDNPLLYNDIELNFPENSTLSINYWIDFFSNGFIKTNIGFNFKNYSIKSKASLDAEYSRIYGLGLSGEFQIRLIEKNKIKIGLILGMEFSKFLKGPFSDFLAGNRFTGLNFGF